MIALLGRGHVLHGLGFQIACSHADEDAAVCVERPDDAGDDDRPAHSHCPPNCSRCACGQIPLVVPELPAVPAPVLTVVEIAPTSLQSAVADGYASRVDRPPRA